MKQIFSLFFTLTLFSSFLTASNIDDFKIMTETYPPYNMKNNNKLQGISVDILEHILVHMGASTRAKDFMIMPWARAYQMVQKKDNMLLFSMFRTKSREKLFKWVGPIDNSIIGLLAKKEKQIKIKRFEDLIHYKIGTVHNDVAEQLLIQKGYDFKLLHSISGVTAIEQSIKKLNRNRIDMFAYIANIKEWKLNIKDFDPHDYEMVYVLEQQALYYAFNKNTSDDLIEQMQNILDQMKQSGEYETIVRHYKAE